MSNDFNTVQYCINNNIPCFTFVMDATKRLNVKWGDITQDTFKNHIHAHHNGFAILTGHTHFAIDFDEKKYNPPQVIKQQLMESCSAVEETPGGFHFWFTMDERTAHLESKTNIKWDNTPIIGLDMRATRGICYAAPSHYDVNGETKRYRWIKGDLSKAAPISNEMLFHLYEGDAPDMDTATVEMFKEGDRVTLKITPKSHTCLVKADHRHSQPGHSCIYLTRLKTCYSATATCFSHGKRKMSKEVCDALVEQFWTVDGEQDILNEYSHIKENFEQYNFKTMSPVGFYTLLNDMWVFRERAQMKTAYENLLLQDGTPFLDKWLKDPAMRTYTKVSTEASADPTVFVLPDPPAPIFVHQTYTCEPNKDALTVFDEFLNILTNRKLAIKEYILNWCAHLLQKPLDLPGVALIFIGQKGVGKDTFGDFVGNHLIGTTYFQNYSNQMQYFDKHDTFKANKFLIKVEELSQKIFSDETNDNYFKSSITTQTISINPKRGTPYEVKNYSRYIGTTNHSNALNVQQNERRYVFSVVSPEKMKNHEYWNRVRTILFNPEGAQAVATMLMERDITKFDVRVLPENTYLKHIQDETVDSVQRFMEQIDGGEYTGTLLYQTYRDYCTAEGLPIYSNTKFSTQLLFLSENGSITRKLSKERTKKSTNYTIE